MVFNRRVYFLLYFCGLYFLSIQAQNKKFDYLKPRDYEIAGISITGVEFLDKNALVNLAGYSVGQQIKVPGEDVGLIIDRYWKQGLFSDVKVYVDSIIGNNIYLNVNLKERPRLNEFAIEGVKKSDRDDIEEQLKIRRGSQVTDNIINNSVNIIKKHYQEKGFFNVEVDVRQQVDTVYSNRVNLVFRINKNEKVKVEEIFFEDNEQYTDTRLRRVMKNTKKIDFNIFKPSRYIEPDFKEDKQSLMDFYNENGYRDAKILETHYELINEKRINLYIKLFEGKKYYFGDIKWVGNTKYTDEALSAVLGIKRGDDFDQTLLDKRLQIDEDAISSLYLDNGYLFFNINPVEVDVEQDTINLEMRIYEGKQATINNVIIKGNTKTNEHVIRRELRTEPGELFSKSDIIRTVRELAQLGHFNPENINPVPMPDPVSGTVDLEYQLEEKPNDQLEVSGGWGANMFVGTIGLRFSNFAVKRIFEPKAWRPIPSGDGQTLSLRAQTNGTYYQSYNMTFVEPWFGGKKPNSFSFSVFHTKYSSGNIFRNTSRYFTGDNVDETKYMTISGVSIGLGRRLKWPDDFFTLFNQLSYQRYNLHEYDGSFARNFEFNKGQANSVTFTTTLGRNSQDQLIYPRRGSNFSISLELTPPYSLFKEDRFWELSQSEKDVINNDAEVNERESALKYKWLEYHKWSFKGAWYTRLIENLVLATKTEFGIKGFYNSGIGHAPFEGYQLGGDGMGYYSIVAVENIGLRGYPNYSLTPYNPDPNSGYAQYSAANVYNKYSLELRYPFALKPSATIYGLVFAEAGNAWYNLNEFNPFSIHRSAGIGLRAFLPMFGLLGIDWGYGFDPIYDPAGNEIHSGGGEFHFIIGQQF